MALQIGVVMAVAFAMTNGLHDAANAIAALVATRTATPAAALALATVFNLLGPLLLGAAVAETVAGIVHVEPSASIVVLGTALTAATAWNLLTWRLGLPSSSGHALVGGLVGAALLEGGADAIEWGGFVGFRPVGVVGVVVAMAVAPLLGFVAGAVTVYVSTAATRRATNRIERPIRGGLWTTSGALAFSHGANNAAKSVGLIAALLVAAGRISTLGDLPLWVRVISALGLTLGTALGGWTIVRTIGRRIYRIRPLDGLAASGGSAGVILGASLLGAFNRSRSSPSCRISSAVAARYTFSIRRWHLAAASASWVARSASWSTWDVAERSRATPSTTSAAMSAIGGSG